MDVRLVFEQMVVLLLLLISGVIAAKTRLLDQEMNRKLTTFTLNLLQPCIILSSVLDVDLYITVVDVLKMLGVGCLMYVVLIALGLLVPVLYRCKPDDKGIYSFMTIFGNVGFMGIPVCMAIFGDIGAFYAAILNIPFNLLAYTIGIALISRDGGKKKINWKLIVNPPLITTFIAIVLLCLHVKFPRPVGSAIELLGNMIVPFSMIIIGVSLCKDKLKNLVSDWHVYAFAPIRLFAAPILVWFVLHFIVKDPALLGSIVIVSAMPAAAISTMFSIEYGGNEQMASKTVFITTVLSVLTLPIVVWILPI